MHRQVEDIVTPSHHRLDNVEAPEFTRDDTVLYGLRTDNSGKTSLHSMSSISLHAPATALVFVLCTNIENRDKNLLRKKVAMKVAKV